MGCDVTQGVCREVPRQNDRAREHDVRREVHGSRRHAALLLARFRNLLEHVTMKNFYTIVDAATDEFVYLDYGNTFCWDEKMPRRSASVPSIEAARKLRDKCETIRKENIVGHKKFMKQVRTSDFKEEIRMLKSAKPVIIHVTFKKVK